METERSNRPAPRSADAEDRPSRDRLWPWVIAVALAVVVVVNAVFIYIAVSGADQVAPSYNEGER